MSLISKKARYALHGLAYIAHREGEDELVRFDEILRYLRAYAPRLTLSPSYLAKLFQEISRAGLVEAVPGPSGGYQLARPAEQIRLLEIVDVLDGSAMTRCCLLSVGECSQRRHCGVGDITHEAEAAFYKVLEKETVASLAARMSFPDLAPGPRRKAR